MVLASTDLRNEDNTHIVSELIDDCYLNSVCMVYKNIGAREHVRITKKGREALLIKGWENTSK